MGDSHLTASRQPRPIVGRSGAHIHLPKAAARSTWSSAGDEIAELPSGMLETGGSL